VPLESPMKHLEEAATGLGTIGRRAVVGRWVGTVGPHVDTWKGGRGGRAIGSVRVPGGVVGGVGPHAVTGHGGSGSGPASSCPSCRLAAASR
jgi:hypothetical protein